jgi:hypothetical protein
MLLEACEGLKDLKIDICAGVYNLIERGSIKELRGFAKLDLIRGLDSFEIIYNSNCCLTHRNQYAFFMGHCKLGQAFDDEVEEMRKLVTQPRVKSISRAKFLQVVSTARLAIPGINRMETGPIGRQTWSKTAARQKLVLKGAEHGMSTDKKLTTNGLQEMGTGGQNRIFPDMHLASELLEMLQLSFSLFLGWPMLGSIQPPLKSLPTLRA